MSQWSLLSELFTVLIAIGPDGATQRVSPFVQGHIDKAQLSSFRFFDDFQFKRPARFRGDPEKALAIPGRLFLAFNDDLELAVRGQLISSEIAEGGVLFVGVPWLAWMRDKYPESEPQFDDFPVHDSQMDQLLLLSSQQKMLEDLKKLNSDVENAKMEVEAQGEARQQFFNRVSHEVRTPLMGVSSALTLLSDTVTEPQALDLLSMAEVSMDRATEVINFALGDAARKESGAEQLKVATDLRHLVKSLHKLFMATSKEKGIAFSVAVDDDVRTQYWCADLLLKEVLINLLSNAIKFTDKGSVHLEIKLAPASQEALHDLIFQVSDSGPGIPKSLREQVFAPFETGVSKATEGRVGTGLGLSMTKAHVETLGGAISVGKSQTGGALFTVSLPLVPCTRPELPVESIVTASTASFVNKRLLLLDDSITNLTLNAQLLRSLGFEVTTAVAGGEAVELVKQSYVPFDLILLDINLPDMTGYEVADRLTRLPQCADTLLVALSGYAQEEEKQKAFASGMAGFVTKPFKRDAIAAEFESLFATQSLNVETTDLATEGNDQIFDSSQCDEMRSLLGADVVRELGESLSGEGSQNIATLQKALTDKRFDEGARAAHTLKSSSKALGLIALSECMATIETQFARGETPDSATLDHAAAVLEQGIGSLKAHLSRV